MAPFLPICHLSIHQYWSNCRNYWKLVLVHLDIRWCLFLTFSPLVKIQYIICNPTQMRLEEQRGVMCPVAKMLRACSDVCLQFNSEELDCAAVGRLKTSLPSFIKQLSVYRYCKEVFNPILEQAKISNAEYQIRHWRNVLCFQIALCHTFIMINIQ